MCVSVRFDKLYVLSRLCYDCSVGPFVRQSVRPFVRQVLCGSVPIFDTIRNIHVYGLFFKWQYTLATG